MGLKSKGLALHTARLLSPEVAGELVTYQRGTQSIERYAALGETQTDEMVGDGDATINQQTNDFLFASSSFAFITGTPIVPARGDVVIRANGERYNVIPSLNGSPASVNDTEETLTRVHTVKDVTIL